MVSVYLLCVYSSQVLYNIPDSLMTAVPLRWHIRCRRVTALGGAAVLVPVLLGFRVLLASGEVFHSCE